MNYLLRQKCQGNKIVEIGDAVGGLQGFFLGIVSVSNIHLKWGLRPFLSTFASTMCQCYNNDFCALFEYRDSVFLCFSL